MMTAMNTSHPAETTADGQKKFLFDREFSAEADVQTRRTAQVKPEVVPSGSDLETVEIEIEEVIVPTFSEEDLTQARAKGHAAGRDEATRDMSSALEQRLATILEAINSQLETVFKAYAQDQEDRNRDAISVATVIARKLFPALNTGNAMAEVEHIVIEAMKRTSGHPTLMIKVPEDMHKDIKAKIEDLAALRGHAGTINIMTETDMPPGDISIEWDGGGMRRDTTLMWREIDQIIERNIGPALASDLTEVKIPSPSSPENSPPSSPQDSRQEVVKPAAFGENEGHDLESQKKDAEKDGAEPSQTAAEPEAPQHEG